ncbi:MAG: hypothetical protein K0Q87_1707 [Neobacillus sp.]|nr:hypothetical protein [Neobacillus sp.]
MNDKQKNNNTTTIVFAGLALGGLAIYFIGFLLFHFYPNMPFGFSFLLEVTRFLSATVCSCGTVALLLEIKTIKKNTISYISDFFSGGSIINNLSNEKLNDLHCRLACKRSGYFNDKDKLTKTIYSIEPFLNQLSTEVYFELDKLECWIEPNSSKGQFTKTYKMKCVIINEFGRAYDKTMIWGFVKEELNDEDLLNKITFEKLDVNRDQRAKFYKKYVKTYESENKLHQFINNYELKIPLTKEGNKITIELHIKYDVPITDLCHTWKVSAPCKEIDHHIHLTGPEASQWCLSVIGFAPKIWPENSFEATESIECSCEVNSRDWVYPGTGYSILLNEKQKN